MKYRAELNETTFKLKRDRLSLMIILRQIFFIYHKTRMPKMLETRPLPRFHTKKCDDINDYSIVDTIDIYIYIHICTYI